MVRAVDHSDAPSRRAVAIIATAVAALFVLLVAGSVVLQSFGTINGENEVAAMGQPISVRVDNDLDIRVDLTVRSLELHENASQPSRDYYLVRYEVSGVGEIAPVTADRVWRLVDAGGTAYVASDYDLPQCQRFDGAVGCVVVAVPAGTDVTMVRYYGVKTFWYEGKPTPSEVWAGWRAR
jgi:hypothetical protein